MGLRVGLIGWMLMTMCIGGRVRAQEAVAPPPAQEEPPATQPTSAPADTTSPKGTLKVLAIAMDSGDVKTLGALILAEGERERRMREAQIRLAQATSVLRQSLIGTFGQQAMAELDTTAAMQQRLATIDAAPAEINGDAARIEIGPDEYDLKRVGGEWKLSLATAARDLDPKMLEQSLDEMSVRSTVYQEVAQEVIDGKYQTTDEVGQALQGKLMVAMMREAAATQPATTEPNR